jgi:hypothetical protein
MAPLALGAGYFQHPPPQVIGATRMRGTRSVFAESASLPIVKGATKFVTGTSLLNPDVAEAEATPKATMPVSTVAAIVVR